MVILSGDKNLKLDFTFNISTIKTKFKTINFQNQKFFVY